MSRPMRFAYADPVYLGMGKLYPEHPASREWDDLETHRYFISCLVDQYPDGWAMSLASTNLHAILPLCPPSVRVAAWCKSFGSFKRGVRPAYMWEPVIFTGGHNPPMESHPPPKTKVGTTPKDFLIEPITLRRGLTATPADRRTLAQRTHLLHGEWPDAGYFDDVLGWVDDAGDFIAANDPATVLADLDLIDAYRELEKHVGVFLTTRVSSSMNMTALHGIAAARARVAELEEKR